jgi:radical SAM protein with 4Fe4S-binding SPASM domain
LPQKLTLCDTVILRAEPQYYDTYAAYDWKTSRTEFLTDWEYRALQHVYDKAADVREISTVSSINYDKCNKFLQRMAEGGYVKTAEEVLKPPPERATVDPALYDQFPIPFLSAPTSVDVFVTSRCNLRCVHCFSSREGKGNRDLSIQELESIFSQLERMGVMEVRLTGGEPLLHPEVQALLAIIQKKRFRKVLITNGTVLDEENVRRLKEAGVIPTVSLEDVNAEEHDVFSGVAGSFKRTMTALNLLQKQGVQYGINCCLHRGNLNRCEDVIKLAIRQGADRIAFLDLKDVGRMKKHREWVPAWSAYQSIFNDLLIAKARYRKQIDVSLDVFLHCYPLQESIQERKRGYVSCKAGKNRMAIDSDAAVYPCNLVLSDPQWVMGNLRKETLADIWFSKKWLFFRGGVRISDLPKCRSCKDLTTCRDVYCRLLPYVYANDVFAPHPACS